MPAKPRFTIFLDCGDTIVDEGTEIKDHRGATLRAELIPGAREMIEGLVSRGYTLALVADGPEDTFKNALGQHDLYRHFKVRAISEIVGVSKPHPRMFETALEALKIPREAHDSVVMVGNNLERDIKGAKRMGLRSVFLSWSDRRTHIPADADEIPDYTISTPLELLDLMDTLESESKSKLISKSELDVT